MPRRAVLTERQRAALMALPDGEPELVRHWTLGADDLRAIGTRRRPHNRLGFALQLCALRYPGRLLRPGEVISHAPLAFVADQIDVDPQALADYAVREPTRYEQLDALRDAFGFRPLDPSTKAELQAWLLPVALATTSGVDLARLLLDEFRSRRVIVPGITLVERMVAQALLEAERYVADLLTRPLTAGQRNRLDGLLGSHAAAKTSVLAWVRQPPGKPGRRAFAAVLDRLSTLRTIELDPALTSAVHPERLRRLGQEGARLTAQHLTTLLPTYRMSLAAAFGSGTASSSDGQHVPLDRRAQATGAVNPHKGSEPAVSFYTHLSDRYAPFHSKVISATAGEAAHVLDGLLHHGADLSIERHHTDGGTDGGGVSDHVFALCHLLGFRFAPRLPNLAARRLHLFEGLEPGPDIAPLVAAPIDERLVADHWTDVLRLAASIRTGVTSASAMLERLGSYPRANGLALALREIGRVERTLFTLDWIESPEERRRATRELNKGEAENALKRAIFFHRTGRLRDHGLQAQGHRASALNLVTGAIVLWNTTYLEAALRHLERQGRPVPPDMLQHLSPLGWQHINLTGDYLWTEPTTKAGQLRPLRQRLTQPNPQNP